MSFRRSLVWLRRDLRLDDHCALFEACRNSEGVVLAFVLDPDLLRGGTIGAPIVQVFFSALQVLRADLEALGSDLVLCEGRFDEELSHLVRTLKIDAVFFNRDTDPHATQRDTSVTAALEKLGVTVTACDDLTYFRADDIRQESGKRYTVFTPYKNRWLARHGAERIAPYPSRAHVRTKALPRDQLPTVRPVPAPEDYGHTSSKRFPRGGEDIAARFLQKFLADPINQYTENRNFPALAGTSRLSPQLRAGTIGIRHCVESAFAAQTQATAGARQHIATWISELIWRDFYHQILVHNPHVVTEPFDERARRIAWGNNPTYFAQWSEARTGYPLIDAAMRQLHTIGWMHNRLRMIVASFLAKDLLVDYRWGEAHFIHWLADGDLAANNGGWQWAASTGTDAAPYFRVFNPVTQSQTYDPDGRFIRLMVPELQGLSNKAIHAPWTATPLELKAANIELGSTYPLPIIDHASARLDALNTFGAVFGKAPKA